jgi:hypothetical protein
MKPRRFHAYCVGTAKSGTHSIADLFRINYRAAHEAESEELINTLLDTWNSPINKEALIKYIRARDKTLYLELDSSQLNYFLIDILIKEFPDTKFILTIRDCYSWLDSFINHQLARPCPPNWLRMRDFRFKHSRFKYAEEQILAQHGLYTLDGYLSYWAEHNREVLAKVPKSRSLMVRTHDISTEIKRIAEFVGVPPETLNREKSHSFKAKEHFNILSSIDKYFLEEKINIHWKSLMNEVFPDFSLNKPAKTKI